MADDTAEASFHTVHQPQPDGSDPDGTPFDDVDPYQATPDDHAYWLTSATLQPLIQLPPTTTRRRRLTNRFHLVIGTLLTLVVAGTTVAFLHEHGTSNTGAAPATPRHGGALAPAYSRPVVPLPGTGAPSAAGPHTISGPAGAVQTASFQLDTGVTTVSVRAVDLGTTLFRATTPDPSGYVPRATQDGGSVRLQVVKVAHGDGTNSVTVELNSRVPWQVVFVRGSSSASVDLRGAAPDSVDFAGGVGRIELWLPDPQGAQLVRMTGGAREMLVHAPRAAPVRLGLGKGASSVVVDGARHSQIAAGTRFVTMGWEQARNRYDVDAAGGVATLTIDRY